MSLLHTRLRMVLLAKDVLQELAWEYAENDEVANNGEVAQALQDAADAVHEVIDVVGRELQ